MISDDIVMGLVVGLVHGFLFRSCLTLCFKRSVYLVAKVLSSAFFVTVLGSLMACIGAGLFLLAMLSLKSVIIVWKVYVAGWTVGFVVGATIYVITHRGNTQPG